MEQRLSIVTLGVSDLTASRSFYQRLGWSPSATASNDEIVFFQLGGIVLALYGRAALAKDAGLEPGRGFGGVALAYNARCKDDVDATLAAAKDAGARILKPAEEAFWGGYSGCFADPDGHPWEVAWNPHFAIQDDGSIKLPE
jgi:catechol 2,3-dioxygenase-like lactoylglutathione lyase family enzyme